MHFVSFNQKDYAFVTGYQYVEIVKLMANEEESESGKYSFLLFVIASTLKVVGLTLCILSPWILYVGLINLGLRGEPFNYVAFAFFWSYFVVIVLLAAVIDWIRKRKKTK